MQSTTARSGRSRGSTCSAERRRLRRAGRHWRRAAAPRGTVVLGVACPVVLLPLAIPLEDLLVHVLHFGHDSLDHLLGRIMFGLIVRFVLVDGRPIPACSCAAAGSRWGGSRSTWCLNGLTPRRTQFTRPHGHRRVFDAVRPRATSTRWTPGCHHRPVWVPVPPPSPGTRDPPRREPSRCGRATGSRVAPTTSAASLPSRPARYYTIGPVGVGPWSRWFWYPRSSAATRRRQVRAPRAARPYPC
jgi:hypothetical protein